MKRNLVVEPVSNDWVQFADQFLKANQFGKALHCIRVATGTRGVAYTSWAAALHSVILTYLKQYDEAQKWAKRAIAMNSQDAFGFSSLALIYFRQHGYRIAIDFYMRANELDPNNADIQMNMALCFLRLGVWRKAAKLYEEVVKNHPLRHDARHYYGMTLMLLGDMSGAAHFEARLAVNPVLRADGSKVWQGESLEGKTIAVHMEQGFGDTLMCARYLPLLADRYGADRVTVFCQPRLTDLLSNAFNVNNLKKYSNIYFRDNGLVGVEDFQVASMSLPALMADKHPFATPVRAYLSVESTTRISPEISVGLCWRGAPEHTNDVFRSMSLRMILDNILPPRGNHKIKYYPLQRDMTKQEARLWRSKFGYSPVCPGDGFEETAATITTLDLVVSVDTAVAHLSGALGVPVWILLAKVGDWRWGIHDTKRWYASATLIRQKTNGIWGYPLSKVKQKLRQLAGGKPIV